MNDQASNDPFHASSFIEDENVGDLEQMSAGYAADLAAVDAAWAAVAQERANNGTAAKAAATSNK